MLQALNAMPVSHPASPLSSSILIPPISLKTTRELGASPFITTTEKESTWSPSLDFGGVTTPPKHNSPVIYAASSSSCTEPTLSARGQAPQSPAYMPPVSVDSPRLQTSLGLRKVHRSLRSSARIHLDDKDDDDDDEVEVAFDAQLRREQWSRRSSPMSPPITPTPSNSSGKQQSESDTAAPENLRTFTCPYFYATSNGGIESAIVSIAEAMKIVHARLAAVAPHGSNNNHNTNNINNNINATSTTAASRHFSPMRVCQSTILNLVPISLPPSDGFGGIHLALHLPSLTLMCVKIVPISDGCIKGELEYIRMWAERTVLHGATGIQHDSSVDASAPTLQFYGAFPSEKHHAIVFAYEYMHRGSLTNSLQQEGMTETVASEGFIIGLAFSLLSGLRKLSDKGYTHGDIKPSNILISPTGFCIADFGSMRKAPPPSADLAIRRGRGRGGATSSTTRMSATSKFLELAAVEAKISPFAKAHYTEAFSSPERKLGAFDHLADVWSVGVILAGVTKRIKFCDMARMPEAEDAWTGVLCQPSSFSPSPLLSDLISLCVTPEVSARPTVNQLLDHPALATLDTTYKAAAAAAAAAALFIVPRERVVAQLEVIALAIQALQTIGHHVDITCLSKNMARQMETPVDLVLAQLCPPLKNEIEAPF